MPTSSFKPINSDYLPNLEITVHTYRHEPTGLIHYHLACDNQENAFMIGFATQPTSSRGEAHILEHVVLCGSKQYPVRDPFFSMLKRSLQTFMNAMTASDWTLYPFATQNKKDFFNLLSVYLDAVFFANIDPLDFAQEGVRVVLDDNGTPSYQGIVFNEMKGAMSGEIEQLYQSIKSHLFATTTYHYNSGGDPSDIVTLTHQDLVQFHETYYHPSNAIAMSFGDIDPSAIQAQLQFALTAFDGVNKPCQSKRFFVPNEQRLTAPKSVYDTYASDSEGKHKTHHVVAWLLPAQTCPKQRFAMRLMEGVLTAHSGLPLQQYLETTPLGQAPSPLVGLDDHHHEMVFYAGIRGSEPEFAEPFEQELLALLSDIASRPIDSDTIETVLHQMELDKRHIGGDGMPYGLSVMMEGFVTAIHGGDPMAMWDIDEQLAWLKTQAADPMWLPNLIKEQLIHNPHRVRLTLSPDSQKAKNAQINEQNRLNQLKNSLSDDDKKTLIDNANALAKRQATIDDIELLPKITRDDIPSDIVFSAGTTQPLKVNNTTIARHYYPKGTNGLYYYQLLLTLDEKTAAHPLLPIYTMLLSELGTNEYSARQFQAHQARYGSGVTARISRRTDLNDPEQMSQFLVLSTRALAHKTQAIDVVKQVLSDTIFSEYDRLSELLKQRQLSWQARLSGAGHAYALQTACANMSMSARLDYAYLGLPALVALKQFLADGGDDLSDYGTTTDSHTTDSQTTNSQTTDNHTNNQTAPSPHHPNPHWQTLIQSLQALHQHLSTLPKQVLLVCEPDNEPPLTTAITQSLASIHPSDTPNLIRSDTPLPTAFEPLKSLLSPNASTHQDTAWLIASNVFHNAAAYPAVPTGHKDAPALMVLGIYLQQGYLHQAIREQGGAYGGGANYDGNSASFRFYSYRDPNCMATFEQFTNAIDWLLNSSQEPRQLDEAVLTLIASMDKPASPAGEAIKSCFNEQHGRSKNWQKQLRAQILAVDLDSLKQVARQYLVNKPYVRATVAPIEQQHTLAQQGFVIHTLEPT